jgi:PAX-interacting protein 1
VQPQVANQGQSVSMPLPANESQTRLQFVPWNIQNNVLPSGVQSSAGLSSALSPTVHYHLYYPQPPAAGQNMSGLSSALPLASTMSGLSSATPPALFPAGS